MPATVGIDLGTTYSCIAATKKGKVEIIKNDSGNITTPSYVAFWEKQRLVGEDAKSQQAVNPTNTIFDAKRLIGRSIKDNDIQKDIPNWPFKVVDSCGKPMLQVADGGEVKTLAPEQISAAVLSKLKDIAEKYLGDSVTQAVITVPAYFNEAQRQATKDAALIAGLDVLRLLNEPTAAAIAYGLDKKPKKTVQVLVFDVGGGTFDVSVLALENNKFHVKATDGDTHLGGEDFDSALVNYAVEEFKIQHGSDIAKDKNAMGRLREAVEKVKRILSVKDNANLSVESLVGDTDFSLLIERSKFDELNDELFKNTLNCVQRALDGAKMAKDAIDEIVLVGGSSRIPRIQQLVKEFFNGKQLCKGIHPDQAVAQGAALLAASMEKSRYGGSQDIILQEVIPLSLGVEIRGGVMQHLLKRNASIPAKVTKEFKPVHHLQDEVCIKVYEGERKLVKDNLLLGEFTVSGIPQALAGKARIMETFEVDENGILTVTATIKGDDKKHRLQIITDNGRLTEKELETMVEEAERYKSEDDQLSTFLLAKNRLETCAYDYKGLAKRGHVDEEFKDMIVEKCREVLDWISANPDARAVEYDKRRRELEETFKNPENAVVGELPYYK